MTWIDVIDESEADGELKSVYDSIIKSRGKMSNIVLSQSLNTFWKDSNRVSVLLDDYRIADLSDAQMALCTFSHHLTISASTSKEADVIALRDAGYSDEAILNITLITGYFNFVNRIALALGVEYSETELTGYKYED